VTSKEKVWLAPWSVSTRLVRWGQGVGGVVVVDGAADIQGVGQGAVGVVVIRVVALEADVGARHIAGGAQTKGEGLVGFHRAVIGQDVGQGDVVVVGAVGAGLGGQSEAAAGGQEVAGGGAAVDQRVIDHDVAVEAPARLTVKVSGLPS
jgi:hypothetical protein